jgi:CRP-like cAMP-binding protein
MPRRLAETDTECQFRRNGAQTPTMDEKGDEMDAADWAVVRRSATFRTTDEAKLRDIIGDRSPRTHPRGQVLFLQGDHIDALHLVVSGYVKLYRQTEDGADAIVGIHGPGQSFGETAALLSTPAHATAETISEARILTVDAERLRSRLGADPDLAFAMLASASMHLRSMVDELERLKGLPGPRRVAGFLCDLAGSEEGTAAFDLPYEKSLIAGRLGMTPESFSRALAKLRDHGVSIEREHVRISKVQNLRDFFEGEAA